MAHENTITVQHDNGRWYNLKTVEKGKQLTDRAAKKAWMPVGGSYKTVDNAVKAAVKRSNSFNKRGTR